MKSFKQAKLAFTAAFCVLCIKSRMTGFLRNVAGSCRYTQRWRILAAGVFTATSLATVQAWGAAECPIELGAIEAAKPNKLYLYFPLPPADTAFPDTDSCLPLHFGEKRGPPSQECFAGAYTSEFPLGPFIVRPLQPFDTLRLTSYVGTADDLKNKIGDVVTDVYCEFNVRVMPPITSIPTNKADRGPRHVIVGIGTDAEDHARGIAQETDTGDRNAIGYARVWAGNFNYQGSLTSNPSSPPNNAFTGITNSKKLERWAFSIGSTVAHESGHTYGLGHETNSKLIMFDNESLVSDGDRAGLPHFSDESFGVLAANVGLSVQTIHNWDFTNPNAEEAHGIQFDLLTTALKPALSWYYSGDLSPWTTPIVSEPIETTTFQGSFPVYTRYHVTWSAVKAWANGPDGTVQGGARFHVGAAFSNVDFAVSDPVIVANVRLLKKNGTPLELHPRMVGYDTGVLRVRDGSLAVNFFITDNLARPLTVRDVVVRQLPRVASIESMVQGAKLETWQGLPITPLKTTEYPELCDNTNRVTSPYWWEYWAMHWGENAGENLEAQGFQVGNHGGNNCVVKGRGNPLAVPVGQLTDDRHIIQIYDGKCPDDLPGGEIHGASVAPAVNKCPNAGINIGLFPSTMLYLTATIVDPEAKHWDPVNKQFVVGPVESRLYYQVAGRHPDLNRNGIDDFIDIKTGTSEDLNGDGVPDEAQRCHNDLRELEACETKRNNLKLLLEDIEREEQSCHGLRCIWLEIRERILSVWFGCQAHKCEEALREFKQCMKQ